MTISMELERIPVANEVVRKLREVVGERNCISDPEQLRTYECAECGHARTYSVVAGNS